VEHPPTHAGPHHLHRLATVGALGVRLSGPAARDIDGGLESLTDHEREIAAVVAERRSNKEVGAALYIAPKTVEHNSAGSTRNLTSRRRRFPHGSVPIQNITVLLDFGSWA
jgi:DNA-binding NarL/FixJ family response regulator